MHMLRFNSKLILHSVLSFLGDSVPSEYSSSSRCKWPSWQQISAWHSTLDWRPPCNSLVNLAIPWGNKEMVYITTGPWSNYRPIAPHCQVDLYRSVCVCVCAGVRSLAPPKVSISYDEQTGHALALAHLTIISNSLPHTPPPLIPSQHTGSSRLSLVG